MPNSEISSMKPFTCSGLSLLIRCRRSAASGLSILACRSDSPLASAFDVGYPYEFLGRMTGGKW